VCGAVEAVVCGEEVEDSGGCEERGPECPIFTDEGLMHVSGGSN
jgi:hypothetical protein